VTEFVMPEQSLAHCLPELLLLKVAGTSVRNLAFGEVVVTLRGFLGSLRRAIRLLHLVGCGTSVRKLALGEAVATLVHFHGLDHGSLHDLRAIRAVATLAACLRLHGSLHSLGEAVATLADFLRLHASLGIHGLHGLGEAVATLADFRGPHGSLLAFIDATLEKQQTSSTELEPKWLRMSFVVCFLLFLFLVLVLFCYFSVLFCSCFCFALRWSLDRFKRTPGSRTPFKGVRGPLKRARGPLQGPRGSLKGPRVPSKGPRGRLKGPRCPL